MRIVSILKWVIETLRFIRFIRLKAFTAWKWFFVKTNCINFRQNVKQQRQFIGNDATNFDVVVSRWIVNAQGTTPANFLRHFHLLEQLQTKLWVTCRRLQIDTIAKETSQPSTDGEADPNPVGGAWFTRIRAAVVTQGLKGGNWYHCCDQHH